MSDFNVDPKFRKAYVFGVWRAVEEIAFNGLAYVHIISTVLHNTDLTLEECMEQLENSKLKYLPDLDLICSTIESALEDVFIPSEVNLSWEQITKDNQRRKDLGLKPETFFIEPQKERDSILSNMTEEQIKDFFKKKE